MRKIVLRNRKDEAAGNDGLSSGTNGLQVRRKAQDFRRWLRKAYSPNECQYVREWLFLLRGPKVRKELPALAAKLRAFSSLLSLPSQAQSVIKAFRRQGIGDADVVNTARFFLSRLESLFAAQKVFQIFRGRAGRDCARSVSHRLAKERFSVMAFVILSVGLCQSRKDRYLPPERLCVRLLPRPTGLPPRGSGRFL